jgi:hypothetical protein
MIPTMSTRGVKTKCQTCAVHNPIEDESNPLSNAQVDLSLWTTYPSSRQYLPGATKFIVLQPWRTSKTVFNLVANISLLFPFSPYNFILPKTENPSPTPIVSENYSLCALLSSLLSVSHPPQEKSAHPSSVLCTFTVRRFDITFVLDNNPHPIRSSDEDCCHVDALYLLSLSSTSPFTPWLRMLSQPNFESGCSCHWPFLPRCPRTSQWCYPSEFSF